MARQQQRLHLLAHRAASIQFSLPVDWTGLCDRRKRQQHYCSQYLLHVQRHPTESNAGAPRALLGARSQSFQPGISGGEAATAALASANAACNAASFVWSREVFSTVPPSPLSLSSTLSAVTLRTSTKSAAVPGGRAGWRHEYRRARVGIRRRKGLRRLRSRRQCIPTPTDGLTFKTHRTR